MGAGLCQIWAERPGLPKGEEEGSWAHELSPSGNGGGVHGLQSWARRED